MVKKINYICVELLKAIHNKDYSVVKTFKAGATRLFLFLEFSNFLHL